MINQIPSRLNSHYKFKMYFRAVQSSHYLIMKSKTIRDATEYNKIYFESKKRLVECLHEICNFTK